MTVSVDQAPEYDATHSRSIMWSSECAHYRSCPSVCSSVCQSVSYEWM